MKAARFFSAVFAVAGTILMLGTTVLCLTCRNAGVKVKKLPEGAVNCSESLMEALAAGDYAAAGNLIYGQPDLGAGRGSTEDPEDRIWNAFLDSISYEFSGTCYVVDSGFAREADITTLDLSSVTDAIAGHAYTLLTQRVEAAEDMSELYDEGNHFRQDLVDQVLEEAALQALEQDARTVTSHVTMKLICRDGQWCAVPDQALLQAISGGAARG